MHPVYLQSPLPPEMQLQATKWAYSEMKDDVKHYDEWLEANGVYKELIPMIPMHFGKCPNDVGLHLPCVTSADAKVGHELRVRTWKDSGVPLPMCTALAEPV